MMNKDFEVKRDDPRDVAREYLKNNKVDKLFQEIGSALLFERPEDVEGFLLKKLREIKAKKEVKEHSSIFNDRDLETLFHMYDKEKKGVIDSNSCKLALGALGIDERVMESIMTDGPFNLSKFIELSKSGLVQTRDC